jgi:hypothetical protein
MPLVVYVEDQNHERMAKTHEDHKETFLSLCEASPEGSILRAVNRYGDTMFNETQLAQFVAELNELPPEKRNSTVRKLAAAAEFAIASYGYLFFAGEPFEGNNSKEVGMAEHGFDYDRASDEIIAARTGLASQVCVELKRAGLPAFLHDSQPEEKAGAVVYVDRGADVTCGVTVGWSCDPAMIQAACDKLQEGDPTAPVVRYPGVIATYMQSALVSILLSAGFVATPEEDTMNPDHVQVFGRKSDLMFTPRTKQ